MDVNEILAAAQKATGLSDFGDSPWREGLRALADTYSSGQLTEKGEKRGRRRLGQLMATRLRIEAALRRHPEICEREIRSPMVLTGLPRSGTSALFNLLAADPAARPLLLWETQFPDPPDPPVAPGQPDPRHEAVRAYYAQAREKNPEFTAIHFADADTPEECVLLHAYALNGVQHGTEVMLEPYASWYRKQDLGPMYRYYRDLLRMLDWQRPGERWLLKAPAHMWGIDALIETFPDVSIVWSHRNPALCTASISSMTWVLMQGEVRMDKAELGPIVMDFYATSLERGLARRDAADPARFVDVHHDDFVERPMAVAEQVYGHFGLSLTEGVQSAFERHVESNPKGKHGKHEYGLEEFGLTLERVRERFAPYMERFGLEA